MVVGDFGQRALPAADRCFDPELFRQLRRHGAEHLVILHIQLALQVRKIAVENEPDAADRLRRIEAVDGFSAGRTFRAKAAEPGAEYSG